MDAATAKMISIHAPREGSDPDFPASAHAEQQISIHAPREGSDLTSRTMLLTLRHFYPRSPRGERLEFGEMYRVEGKDFYPRSPRGERPPVPVSTSSASTFLSTLPARGATHVLFTGQMRTSISIHAPREGSDMICLRSLVW